ncbi:uncharacterized protein ARMOST_13001 [Armillaria ostoyae]|uniref:GPI anchored protein n=1 Tax=Armillaria ostoyae TaxID=47428 RepID=A0A284RLI1_ARMOS|nr:uncharacterized protein ARMOST_13001 [Armillaria ostoyae]
MKFSLFSLSAVFALVGSALAQGDLTINTPWRRLDAVSTDPPQLVRRNCITAGTDPNGNPVADLGQQSGTSFTWTVTFPQGTGLVFNIRDQTGAVKQTAPVTVQTGGSTDCTSSTAAGSSTSGSTESTSGGAASTTAAATSTGGATTSATTPAGSTTRTTAASSGASTSRASSAGSSGTSAGASAAASSSGNAAHTQFSSMGAAGVIGAAIVALFA